MAIFDRELIARAIQKRDKTRVALRKAACGAVMIDGLTFSVSVESDGAANAKGAVFTLSGEAVSSGELSVDMIDMIVPTQSGGVRSIKRKPAYQKKKDGGYIYRCSVPEAYIHECSDGNVISPGVFTEEELSGGMNKQIVFRFTPRYSGSENAEIMINIYPAVNPLDGSCTEWVPLTSDREFFEHGGLAAFSESIRKGKK